MEVLRYQGKILYVGSSNFAGWHMAKAQEAQDGGNLLGLVSEQSIYNLLARAIELEVVPAAVDYGLGIIPWSPLQGGLLGGVVGKEREGSRRTTERSARRRSTPTGPSWRNTRRTARSSVRSRPPWRWPGS